MRSEYGGRGHDKSDWLLLTRYETAMIEERVRTYHRAQRILAQTARSRLLGTTHLV